MRVFIVFALLFLLVSCNLQVDEPENGSATNPPTSGELYTVTRIIDGDTIEVRQGEVTYRVRYVGVNTPENDETCYTEAAATNRGLVEGQQVRLERDESNTDRYGRLLRYIYVGDTFVNEVLIREGWAEAVLYEPDDRFITVSLNWKTKPQTRIAAVTLQASSMMGRILAEFKMSL